MNFSFKLFGFMGASVMFLSSCGMTQNAEVTNTGGKTTQESTVAKVDTSSSGSTDTGVIQTGTTSTGVQETVQSGAVKTEAGLSTFETVIFGRHKEIVESQKIPRIWIQFQYPSDTFTAVAQGVNLVSIQDKIDQERAITLKISEVMSDDLSPFGAELQQTLQIGWVSVKKYYTGDGMIGVIGGMWYSYIVYVWNIKECDCSLQVSATFKKTDTQVLKIIDQIARSVVITQNIKPDTTLPDKEYSKNIKRVGGVIHYNKSSYKFAPVFIELDWADAATFETYEQSDFMKDKYRVYSYEDYMAGSEMHVINSADPATFKVIDYLFARDKDTVFRRLQSSYVWIDIKEDFELIDEQDIPKVKIGGKEYLLDFTGEKPHVVGLPVDEDSSHPLFGPIY